MDTPRRLKHSIRVDVRGPSDGYRRSEDVELEAGTLIERYSEVAGDLVDLRLPGDDRIFTAGAIPAFLPDDHVVAFREACAHLGALGNGLSSPSIAIWRPRAALVAFLRELPGFKRQDYPRSKTDPRISSSHLTVTYLGVEVTTYLHPSDEGWYEPAPAPEAIAADPAAHDDQEIGAVA